LTDYYNLGLIKCFAFYYFLAGVAVEKLLYQGYCVMGTVLYGLLWSLLPPLKRLGSRYSYGLEQRLGVYEPGFRPNGKQKCIWLHASSVGEVQAALLLVHLLRAQLPDTRLMVTTTTEQGQKFAQRKLPEGVACFMAPLDFHPVVHRVLSRLQPDVYVCLETELWPVLLHAVSKQKIAACLVNARLSERSHARYMYIQSFMADVLQAFNQVVAITEDDARRLMALGVPPERISISGNIKTAVLRKDRSVIEGKYNKILNRSGQIVFLCGSTHQGEEELLFPVYQQLRTVREALWIIAPRHLERVPEITRWLTGRNIGFQQLSTLKTGAKRSASVIVVDTMGDLAELYSVATFSFCGGSLVPKGGHNIMEVVQWEQPVYFGPYMNDFKFEAKHLCKAGCGFQVNTQTELASLLLDHVLNQNSYEQACENAQGVLAQGDFIVNQQVAAITKLVHAT